MAEKVQISGLSKGDRDDAEDGLYSQRCGEALTQG